MGSSLRAKPTPGQLALLSKDENDTLALDEPTKEIGRRGVAAAREAIRKAHLARAQGAT